MSSVMKSMNQLQYQNRGECSPYSDEYAHSHWQANNYLICTSLSNSENSKLITNLKSNGSLKPSTSWRLADASAPRLLDGRAGS